MNDNIAAVAFVAFVAFMIWVYVGVYGASICSDDDVTRSFVWVCSVFGI